VFVRSVKVQENETSKKTPKKSSGRIKIGQVFKKTPTKENGGNLFGVPLNRICDGENLPKPVMVSLTRDLKIDCRLSLSIMNTLTLIFIFIIYIGNDHGRPYGGQGETCPPPGT